MTHLERETDRDRRVNGVTSRFEDLPSDITGVWTRRNHYAVLGSNGCPTGREDSPRKMRKCQGKENKAGAKTLVSIGHPMILAIPEGFATRVGSFSRDGNSDR